MEDKFILVILCCSIFACALTITLTIVAYYKDKKRQERILNKKVGPFMSIPREDFERSMVSSTNDYLTSIDSYQDLYYLYTCANVSDQRISEETHNNSFFTSLNIDLDALHTKKNQVCCLIPFLPLYMHLSNKIKDVCAEMNLKCYRTDDEYVASSSLSQNIIKSIVQSPLIIAVLDGRNSNVTYEIGIAHALGKPVILVLNQNQMKEKPFHFNDRQIVQYRNLDDLQLQLKKAISTVLNNQN